MAYMHIAFFGREAWFLGLWRQTGGYEYHEFASFFFYWVLQPVEIISLILSRVDR